MKKIFTVGTKVVMQPNYPFCELPFGESQVSKESVRCTVQEDNRLPYGQSSYVKVLRASDLKLLLVLDSSLIEVKSKGPKYRVRQSRSLGWSAYLGKVKLAGGLCAEADAWEVVSKHQNGSTLPKSIDFRQRCTHPGETSVEKALATLRDALRRKYGNTNVSLTVKQDETTLTKDFIHVLVDATDAQIAEELHDFPL